MAHISEDRILESSTTTGTGAFTLAGALSAFRPFSDVMSVGDTCWYAIWRVDGSGNPTVQFEVGLGTYSAASTLTRTTVLESSNAGAVVNFLLGTKYVALTLTASNTAQFDNIGAAIFPLATAEPPTPASGLYLYAKELLPGNTALKTKRPSGVDSPVQDSISFNRFIKYQGGGVALVAIGGGSLTAATAGASITPTAGPNILNALSRTQFSTAATANAINSVRAGAVNLAAQVIRGTIDGEGGFRVVMRFNLSALQANNRFFAGLVDVVAAPTNVDPFTSTTPGKVGLAVNTATDANWRLVHNITGTAPTTIALGANYPVNITDLIELVLFCRPRLATSGNITYRVRRYTTTGDPAFETTGTLLTNTPGGGTFLYPVLWMVNVTAAVASFQANSITIESDF